MADNNIFNANPVTYADWANTRDPDGKTADILEILKEDNPIIADAYVREGNLTEGHQTTIRTGLPRGTWVAYNEGSDPQKANSRPTIDRAGRMQAYSEVDKALVELEADQAAFRLSESSAFLQGMSIDHAETLFYGNSLLEPKKFMGLTPRYNDIAAESGYNIINGQIKINNWMKGGLIGVASLYILVVFAMPILGQDPSKLAPLFDDPFAVGNLEAQVNWTGLEVIPGIVLLGILIVSIRSFNRKQWNIVARCGPESSQARTRST